MIKRKGIKILKKIDITLNGYILASVFCMYVTGVSSCANKTEPRKVMILDIMYGMLSTPHQEVCKKD